MDKLLTNNIKALIRSRLIEAGLWNTDVQGEAFVNVLFDDFVQLHQRLVRQGK